MARSRGMWPSMTHQVVSLFESFVSPLGHHLTSTPISIYKPKLKEIAIPTHLLVCLFVFKFNLSISRMTFSIERNNKYIEEAGNKLQQRYVSKQEKTITNRSLAYEEMKGIYIDLKRLTLPNSTFCYSVGEPLPKLAVPP